MSLEVLFRSGHEGETRPPLVFIPGSYHGAWCWEENFSPYLSQKGYDCYALSLRAQGGSDRGDLKLAGTLDSHAQDIANFVSSLGRPPVLVAHSFSGLFALRFIDGSDRNNGFPNIAGVALLCSTPPSGNGKLIGRFFRRDPLLSVQITWAFVTKSFARSLEACQQTFFSPDIPNEDLERYQAQLAACSSVPLLDIRAVNKDLPLPKPRSQLPPSFVLGGVEDRIVDRWLLVL
ncbi:unnamed protein product [Ostreobium quekettii]|uniref:AB hydrolase-1 domain-containing protein n=1 Tax=Ostreobium quekettii TaxID=121088 RepID=A0A8S1IZE7_9CHLO|nr:unnamed protein product [Ostreobium quekettii]